MRLVTIFSRGECVKEVCTGGCVRERMVSSRDGCVRERMASSRKSVKEGKVWWGGLSKVSVRR